MTVWAVGREIRVIPFNVLGIILEAGVINQTSLIHETLQYPLKVSVRELCELL
jgi:hypothetical protein